MTSESKANDAQRAAFAREAMIHVDHLYRVAYHLVREADAVQDLIQDSFVRAIESYKLFDPPTNMRAWLTKILQNIFFDQYRKQRRWIAKQEMPRNSAGLWDQGPAQQSSPEGELLHKELSDQITQSLQHIPEEYRLPIVLVDMSEFSYTEAAEILSCPVGTIRSRLSRGRRLLQEQLTGYVNTNHGTEEHDLRGSRRTYHRPG
ncbi:MAG: sigma-70 family RNA polymerase sigma factor [Deltaproteobacteria bacterium]|nr:sigma-70 family RNA polymerase sigma factor [Deltaproteobacteria bacterium]